MLLSLISSGPLPITRPRARTRPARARRALPIAPEEGEDGGGMVQPRLTVTGLEGTAVQQLLHPADGTLDRGLRAGLAFVGKPEQGPVQRCQEGQAVGR